MKNIKLNLLLISCFFLTAFSCHAQNGPTPPSATLSWTQSTSAGVTANCVYRGLTTGNYVLPAIFCSTSPITSYKDTTVTRGVTYHYAVTAKKGSIEGEYSTDSVAIIPDAPNAPVPSGTILITKNEVNNPFNLKVKVK